jgi:cation:H+ antiporter
MLLNIIIIIITTYTTWYMSKMLSKGTENIGKKYNISPSVKGATLDAVGSSFPEFCTVIFCLIAGSFEASIGAITGSALFNILIIPSICVIVTKKMPINKEVVYRDGFIYILAVLLFILAIISGPKGPLNNDVRLIPSWTGLVAITLYISYMVLLVKQSKNEGEPKNEQELPLFKIIIFFIAGMGGIAISIHFLVVASLALFDSLGLSRVIAGVTVLAVATSLPDTFLSVISAKKGEFDAALSNTLGSNTFNILICLGLPIFYGGGVYINWPESAGILFYLLGVSIISMLLIASNWAITKFDAGIMSVLYFIFIILIFIKVI